MTVAEFIGKWKHHELKERAAAQEHFIDLCHLVGHPTPAQADPAGHFFTFERGAAKATGGDGWADVWKKGFFGWEYKGRDRDLDAAYLQLLKYQGALENPPLLVTCDTDRIVVHTHFPNTPSLKIELSLEGIADPAQFAVLQAIFHGPERLRPDKTIQAITQEAAEKITTIAQALRGRQIPPNRVARFLDRVVFCLFAEDVGLLPNKIFTRLVENTQGKPDRFRSLAAELFEQMAYGGDFGADRIEHFNGNLFEATEALDITPDELRELLAVTQLDWSNIDASIFGTLFERALDPDNRTQLGAHYTSREDIETLVEPVVMAPLRHEWAAIRDRFNALTSANQTAKQWKDARVLIRGFLDRLASVTVLDPACGSGNFLFVTLQKLKDLEKEVIIHAGAHFPFFPQVGPWQLRGIEVNAYAHELAQMTVWIGHLQWHDRHGMPLEERPILRTMENFEHKDAVLNFGTLLSMEPDWPTVDFIVSNPPFLGDKFMRGRLGDAYVEALRTLYKGRVPGGADLCCYWFEKARAQIEAGKCKRAGLLATQGIRGGANREVLKRILDTGGIFFAVSDREWVLDGANVHISIVAFDDGSQTERVLDGKPVHVINANLTAEAADLGTARRIATAGTGLAFIGTTKKAPLDIPEEVAREMLLAPTPTGRPNSDVVVPYMNAKDVVDRPSRRWIIDFPVSLSEREAAHYEAPFAYVKKYVQPLRANHREPVQREYWWRLARPVPDMKVAIARVSRFIVTPTLSKHRIFIWTSAPTNADHQLVVFASEDDYLFGLLHSRIHQLWGLRQGTRLETRPRYTPTTTFFTFPFPLPNEPQQRAIAEAARTLDVLRSRWLNPPEWVREHVLTFPASVDGPWAKQVSKPNQSGVGTAEYRQLVAIDDEAKVRLKKRTLTKLYNERPTWLHDAHQALDEAVFRAYGWNMDINDEELLRRLLSLNKST